MTSINTNFTSLIAQNNLNKANSAAATAIERLSSGMRINGAKDDAAGMAIANRMTSQINGMTQAKRNANDAISIAATAETALTQINTNLQRVRELAQQGASETLSATDRDALQTEISSRLDDIDAIANSAQFNGIKILDGSTTSLKFQIGANSGDELSVSLTAGTVDKLVVDNAGAAVDLKTGAVADFDAAKATMASVDAAIKLVDEARSGLGSVQNRFQSVINNLDSSATNLTASRSQIQDADMAAEISNMSRAQILQQAGTSMLAQANQMPNLVLSLLR